MVDLWRERTVGIKLWGFDSDPNEFAEQFPVLSEVNRKGDPHGAKRTYPENQVYFACVLGYEDYWGDKILELIDEMGGVDKLKNEIASLSPKKVLVVINKFCEDFSSSLSNDLSKESIETISKLQCDISFNFFSNN